MGWFGGGWGWGRGRRGWSGPWPGRGPFSYLPPWQRPGWLYGRGSCWWLFGGPWNIPSYYPYSLLYYRYPYWPPYYVYGFPYYGGYGYPWFYPRYW